MTVHTEAPVHVICVCFALVFFAVAAFVWPAPVEPWRTRLTAAGLFFWVLSTFFNN